MSADFMEIQITPTSMVVYSFLGMTCLTILYGIYGALLIFLRFLRLRPKRFFKTVERPSPPVKAMDPIYGNHEMIKLKSSGISLHYVSKGLPNQPMILFVHGFPECWYTWRYQMKYFSKNYRVVAIDQRGYGLSSKPPFAYDYRVETLAGDVADVIEQLGYESCILVGHDLGGLVAWVTAMLYPHLIEKLIIMNCPHPNAFRYELPLSQIPRSWYMFFNQIPLAPEILFQSNDFSIFEDLFHKKSLHMINKDFITDEDIEVYKYTFSQIGTPKSAMNHYRALLRYESDFLHGNITVPVLLLWSSRDPIFDEQLAHSSQKYSPNIRLTKIPNTSHWINQDVPDVINRHIEIFLDEQPPMEHGYEI